jgi:hypothetical protein
MITDKDIQVMKLVAMEEYGVEITDSEAIDACERGLNFMRAIFKMIPNEQSYEHQDATNS